MAIVDAHGLPLAVHTASTSPPEIILAEATFAEVVTMGQVRRLIEDRAYDSNPYDEKLKAQGIELIASHRKGRKKPATQDGRVLRRYRRCWKVELFFA